MIEIVRGPIVRKTPTYCVIDYSGIGIGIHISLQTFQKLDVEGENIQLLTYLHVREDALQLYGFMEEVERDIFKKLISVGGIGPRLAMTILSGLTVGEVQQAIVGGDHDILTRIPGVGKKTAMRVILELKEKLGKSGFPVAADTGPHKSKYDEALLALMTLGYKQAEVKSVLESVINKHGKELNLEQLIKYSLQEM